MGRGRCGLDAQSVTLHHRRLEVHRPRGALLERALAELNGREVVVVLGSDVGYDILLPIADVDSRNNRIRARVAAVGHDEDALVHIGR